MKPSEFPLGSRQSRAAARALLDKKQSAYDRREVVICTRREGELPHATEWGFNDKDMTAGRVIGIPEGMTVAEALRTLGGYSDAEIAGAAEACSEPVDAATFLFLHRPPRIL